MFHLMHYMRCMYIVCAEVLLFCVRADSILLMDQVDNKNVNGVNCVKYNWCIRGAELYVNNCWLDGIVGVDCIVGWRARGGAD